MIFEDRLDAHAFLKRGWFRTRLPRVQADFMLRMLSRFKYLPLPSDHCDAGPRERADLESSPAAAAALDRLCVKAIEEDLADLVCHYRVGAEPRVVTPLRLGSGYSLDWHNHLRAGCTATLLFYLFDDGNAGEGGDLLLGTLGSDMQSVSETERFAISHGDVILIGDASHPLMMHKAEPWAGAGHRHLVSVAYNASDW